MLQVLHIRSSFNPGGTETLLLNLFNYKQNKSKIHLALIKGGNYVSKLQNNNNIFYEYYRKWVIDISVLLKLNRLIKKNCIKIVHTHQEIELLYAVILKLFNPNIRIYHSIHLTNQEYNVDHFLEIFLIKFAYKILPVSNSLKNHLKQKGYPTHKLVTLYNAVSLPSVVDKKKIESFKQRINYSKNDYIIMMTGNFRPEKDQLTIVKAFNLLKDKHTSLKLVFIGKESSQSDTCKKITLSEDLNKRVFFLGAIEDAWMCLEFCNLFVFSSLSETFGIAVIEALLMKVSVLASDIEVMKELSVNGNYFKLFKTGDEKDLSDKIELFENSKNDDETYDIINKAYSFALSEFSYEKYIDKLVEVYCD